MPWRATRPTRGRWQRWRLWGCSNPELSEWGSESGGPWTKQAKLENIGAGEGGQKLTREPTDQKPASALRALGQQWRRQTRPGRPVIYRTSCSCKIANRITLYCLYCMPKLTPRPLHCRLAFFFLVLPKDPFSMVGLGGRREHKWWGASGPAPHPSHCRHFPSLYFHFFFLSFFQRAPSHWWVSRGGSTNGGGLWPSSSLKKLWISRGAPSSLDSLAKNFWGKKKRREEKRKKC